MHMMVTFLNYRNETVSSVIFSSNHTTVWHHITEVRVGQKASHEAANKAFGGDNGRSWNSSVSWET